MGYKQLTPVQRFAVNILSEYFIEQIDENGDRVIGKYDLMSSAQTGSGKTLAYLLPIMNRLLTNYPYEAMKNLVCRLYFV